MVGQCHRSGASRWEYPIFSSDRVKDRKSVFLAHASTLPAPSQLNNVISHLTSLSVRKKATHCMYAYRIVLDPANPSNKIVGQYDGGESGSGERLSRLLEANECNNVVVVVSRWYGGVKLGSDRWKLISIVAKEALLRGNFIEEKNVDTTKTTGKPGAKEKKK